VGSCDEHFRAERSCDTIAFNGLQSTVQLVVGKFCKSEVQKDSQDVSAGIGQFFKSPIYKNFVRNLTSTLARSTLTSPGRIRVKLGRARREYFLVFRLKILPDGL
jgi:hypothetical protein